MSKTPLSPSLLPALLLSTSLAWSPPFFPSLPFLPSTSVEVFATTKEQETEHFFDVLYNNYNGLPTSEANHIVQTGDGSIWIASYSSLIRYDGRDFVSYSDQGLTSVLCLMVDQEDRLWIGTNNDGVVLYENHTFTFLGQTQELPSYSARSLTLLEDGSVLVGTALGIYQILSDFSVEFLEDPLLQNAFIPDIQSFGQNQSVGVTKVGDLFLLEDLNLTHFIPFSDWGFDTPMSVLPVENQEGELTCIYVGTSGDYLIKLEYSTKDPTGFSFEEIPTPTLRYANHLSRDSQGNVWIITDSGAGYLDENETFHLLDYLSVTQSLEHIYEDFQGNYWISSSKDGVLKLNTSLFKNVSAGLDDVVQFNGVTLLDGYIYIVSSNGIDIIRQSDMTVIENTLTTGYRGEYFRCVQSDQEGNLWFSSYTDDGLIKYNPTTQEIKGFNVPNGINYTRIRSTMTGSDGKIWVATGNGIYVVEKDKVIAYFGLEEGLQNLEILTLSQDWEGRVYAGTDGAGVYVIQDMEIVKQINRQTGLLSDIILRTETDPFSGATWIVTGNSIVYYDPTEESLTHIDKFPYGNNFDLMFHEDTIIILCSNGIYFIPRDNFLDPDAELVYQHKNHLNGLYSSAVANSFSCVEDGILYFCGYKNLISYDLNVTENVSHYVPPVDVPYIISGDAVILPTKNQYFKLKSSANFLEFDILIPTYALEDYTISYTLLGYDQMTHTADYSDFTNPTYTNLPGGDYTFFVELYDNRTQEVINRETFTISKSYSFWEHPTTKAVQTLTSLLLLAGLLKYIVVRREKVSQAKEDAITVMFHDTVEVLAKVIDAKDCYTNGHSKRVAFYSKTIAKALGYSQEAVASAYNIGLLHDVGKVSIPDDVLNKPGRLTKEEFEVMKTHASRGGDILEGIHAWPDLVLGARYHHERYDGNGYSEGLSGKNIPEIARIICVADAFDAMYSSRVYRKQMDLDCVIAELENNAGSQFDPDMVKIFVEIVKSGEINEELKGFSREDAIIK